MVLVAKSKKPASVHHKKRSGQHHNKNKPYSKAYWPYLPLLGIAGIGFILNILWIQPGGSVLAYATNMSQSSLLNDTNAQRLSAGQSNLIINALLNQAAQAKANDMAARGYWSHVTPDGVQPWWFVTNAGYDYEQTGENLAYGFDTSQATVTGWMNSAGHRANILNADYQDVGFGIANVASYQGQGEQTIVVALYGTPAVSAATAPDPMTKPAAQPAAKPSAATTNATTPAPTASNAPAEVAASPAAPATTITQANQNGIQQTAAVAATSANTPSAVTPNANQPVSRLQLAAVGIPSWQVFATTIVIAVAAGIFILRHMFFWHRAIVKGEQFVIKHWKLDAVIVLVVMLGVLLTRTAGFIQ